MPCWVTAAGRAACACRSQLASLLACQMPLKLGLPSTLAGRAAGAWPEVGVIDSETTAPTAAAAMATVIIERDIVAPENLPCIMASLCTFLLLQRIRISASGR